jgi:hypothetical protein
MSRLRIPALLALAVSFCLPSSAQSTQKPKTKAESTAKVAGMRVAIDRRTGRLRQPTAEERRALAQALGKSLNRSTQGLQVKTHANGMQSVDLQGRFQSTSVATVDANGKVHERCITTAAEAKSAGKNPTKHAHTHAEVK